MFCMLFSSYILLSLQYLILLFYQNNVNTDNTKCIHYNKTRLELFFVCTLFLLLISSFGYAIFTANWIESPASIPVLIRLNVIH